jgi:hypothetical protein
LFAELLVGCASEALEHVEKREIEVIEVNHGDCVHLFG